MAPWMVLGGPSDRSQRHVTDGPGGPSAVTMHGWSGGTNYCMGDHPLCDRSAPSLQADRTINNASELNSPHYKSSIYRVYVYKLHALFSCSIRANDILNKLPPHTLSGTRFDQMIGANRAGKSGHTLFNCISVTDGIKMNEQNKLIGIGLLYQEKRI